jgi:hypothetical protein
MSGRPEGEVGDLARVAQAAHGLGEPAGAPLVEDALDEGAVLAGELRRVVARRLGFGDGLEVEPQGGAALVVAGGAEHGSLDAPNDDGPAVGVLDGGHGADPGVAPVDVRHEEEPTAALVGGGGHGRLGLGRVGEDRDDHAGSDDAGGQGEDRKGLGGGVSHGE